MPRPFDEADLERLIRANTPVTRRSVRHGHNGRRLGGTDSVEWLDEEGIQSLELTEPAVCGYGHLVGPGYQTVTGRCAACSRFLCSTQGCMQVCVHGCTICAAHARRIDGEIYCSKHTHIEHGVRGVSAVGRFLGRLVRGYNPFGE